ncbi:hypothetical protein [Chryseolinea lacunae]|uniref:Uncharacterized protein n=1 Tax=Chryseolinea lacunae TaxID=2801331 RepID=A0ABS1KWJ2_9BACT|nr:hypothetical protein [Chryseolinea lacunae]MBL0743830.1 hypothetical protein [Chryseolinea lacunae]
MPEEDNVGYVNTKLEFDTSAMAILALDSSKHVIGDRAIASATITQAELAVVDSLMKAYVADYNASLTNDRGDLYRINMGEGNYRIQIVAFFNSEGEKEAWVNVFCKVSGDYWKTRPVVVFDGGACYFQIDINLTRKEIDGSFVNGLG